MAMAKERATTIAELCTISIAMCSSHRGHGQCQGCCATELNVPCPLEFPLTSAIRYFVVLWYLMAQATVHPSIVD